MVLAARMCVVVPFEREHAHEDELGQHAEAQVGDPKHVVVDVVEQPQGVGADEGGEQHQEQPAQAALHDDAAEGPLGLGHHGRRHVLGGGADGMYAVLHEDLRLHRDVVGRLLSQVVVPADAQAAQDEEKHGGRRVAREVHHEAAEDHDEHAEDEEHVLDLQVLLVLDGDGDVPWWRESVWE